MTHPKQIAFKEIRVDAIASTYTYYKGVAPFSTAENAVGWTIDRVVEAPGSAIDRKSATGKWSDRLTLAYS